MYLENRELLYDGCPKNQCPMSDVALALNEFQNLRLFKELGEANRDIDSLAGQINQERKRELAMTSNSGKSSRGLKTSFFLLPSW